MLYTLWHLVVAEIFYLANCPTVCLEQGLDVLLLIAGICLATSDYTSNCGFEWPCHNVRAAKIFDLIAVFFLLALVEAPFIFGAIVGPMQC